MWRNRIFRRHRRSNEEEESDFKGENCFKREKKLFLYHICSSSRITETARYLKGGSNLKNVGSDEMRKV